MLNVKFILYSKKKVLKAVYDLGKRYPSSTSHYVLSIAGRLSASHKFKVLGTYWTSFCRYCIPAPA